MQLNLHIILEVIFKNMHFSFLYCGIVFFGLATSHNMVNSWMESKKKKKYIYIYIYVRHCGTQIHLGLEFRPSNVAHDPNLFLPKTPDRTRTNCRPKFCHLTLARQTIPEQ